MIQPLDQLALFEDAYTSHIRECCQEHLDRLRILGSIPKILFRSLATRLRAAANRRACTFCGLNWREYISDTNSPESRFNPVPYQHVAWIFRLNIIPKVFRQLNYNVVEKRNLLGPGDGGNGRSPFLEDCAVHENVRQSEKRTGLQLRMPSAQDWTLPKDI